MSPGARPPRCDATCAVAGPAHLALCSFHLFYSTRGPAPVPSFSLAGFPVVFSNMQGGETVVSCVIASPNLRPPTGRFDTLSRWDEVLSPFNFCRRVSPYCLLSDRTFHLPDTLLFLGTGVAAELVARSSR